MSRIDFTLAVLLIISITINALQVMYFRYKCKRIENIYLRKEKDYLRKKQSNIKK